MPFHKTQVSLSFSIFNHYILYFLQNWLPQYISLLIFCFYHLVCLGFLVGKCIILYSAVVFFSSSCILNYFSFYSIWSDILSKLIATIVIYVQMAQKLFSSDFIFSSRTGYLITLIFSGNKCSISQNEPTPSQSPKTPFSFIPITVIKITISYLYFSSSLFPSSRFRLRNSPAWVSTVPS